ncbi:TetR/AcrR family transcriptional regulator [Actinoplanes sp. NPDC051851]|uniref:TetR/AcrR family transcriptional regulator n=1 Tax=Actinoplanes sp. NPDC051851 TaxID=3154753 RepID=UPI0034253161
MDEQPAPRRGRGRPREVIRRAPGDGKPLGHRPGDDPPTTRAILDAAHRVLLRAGTKGLTLVAVAREAHVDVTTVSYHFGTRHGLIEALMDRLYATPSADFAEAAAAMTGPRERWHAYLEQVRRMYADGDDTGAYFEIAVLALRDPALRARLARLNTGTVRVFSEAIGGDLDRARAELIFAAVDGIELHRAIAGDDYPTEAVLRLLEEAFRPE